MWSLTNPVLLQVEDELHLIFKVLGTPTEDNWPGISRCKPPHSLSI